MLDKVNCPNVRWLLIGLVLTAPYGFGAEPQPAVKNRAPLAANHFYPLPLTSVKPKGWLLDQLRLQADAITGHLDEIWPDVGPQSAWLGGSGEGWERGPYYLDGLLPAAYLLDDAALIAKAKKWVDWALDNQRPDGGIGPVKNEDWWPNFIMLKVLTQYQEGTGDPRVVPMMRKFFAYQAKMLDQRKLYQWAVFRWHDEVLSVLWLYNRTGDAALLDLAKKLHAQGHGWQEQFANYRFTGKTDRQEATLATHGVNNAMALKAAAVWSLVTNSDADRAGTTEMLAKLDRYHGLPNGMFSADEHYAGNDPSQGIELCAVVEAMFSLELDTAILGNPQFADRLEKIAFNALPGTMSPDLWSHQYDQQPNQVLCTLSQRRWTTNGPESNLFGLEPNFGCCTANLHQGWPKFVSHLWMGTPDDGVAAIAYAPSQVRTVVRGGVAVTVDEETEYPFRDAVRLTVSPAKTTSFPLVVRIPAWADGARVTVNGQAVEGVRPGTFQRIERQWTAGDRVELRFPMRVRAVPGFNESVSIERGPLVYALRIGEKWHKLKQTGPVADWEIYPTSPWNYGLKIDRATPNAAFTVEERPMVKQPFSLEGAPVILKGTGRRLTEWRMVDDSAATPPASPVTSKQEDEPLTLVPYGAARLRITSFPVLK